MKNDYKLVQIFDKPIPCCDFGTPTTQFDWRIEGGYLEDAKGRFCKVGSFAANCWFMVACGKTIKQTLANARRKLTYRMKRAGVTGHFEYVKLNGYN